MAICIRHRIDTENLDYCELCLEDVAIRMAMNMGDPDFYLCGNCGCKLMTRQEAEEHIPFCEDESA